MSKLEEFKDFVRKHPELAKHVNSGKMSWQKFYEMYDMYGEENDTWKEFITVTTVANTAAVGATAFGLAEVINWVKKINLDQVQNGVGNIQRVLGLFQDVGTKSETKTEDTSYKPRPLYKHFED